MTIASLSLLSTHDDYHLSYQLHVQTMTGQINEAPSSMRRCFNGFSASCHSKKFHSRSSVILDMTDEGCMYPARYPTQLHTSKHYESARMIIFYFWISSATPSYCSPTSVDRRSVPPRGATAVCVSGHNRLEP